MLNYESPIETFLWISQSKERELVREDYIFFFSKIDFNIAFTDRFVYQLRKPTKRDGNGNMELSIEVILLSFFLFWHLKKPT